MITRTDHGDETATTCDACKSHKQLADLKPVPVPASHGRAFAAIEMVCESCRSLRGWTVDKVYDFWMAFDARMKR